MILFNSFPEQLKQFLTRKELLQANERNKSEQPALALCRFLDDVESKDVRKKFMYMHRNIVYYFTPTLIRKVVTLLGLPPRMEAYFFVEAVKYQVGALLNQLESVDCVQGCDGDSDESESRSWESWSEESDDGDDDSDSLYTDDDDEWANYIPSSDEVMDSSSDENNDYGDDDGDDDKEEEDGSAFDDSFVEEDVDKEPVVGPEEDRAQEVEVVNKCDDNKIDNLNSDELEGMENGDSDSDSLSKNTESMDYSSFCLPDVEREVYASFQDDSSSTEFTLSDSPNQKSGRENSE